MRRLIPVWGVLAAVLLLASAATAQNGRAVGQVLDRDGKPWPDVTVVMKSDSGRTFTVKTDKSGKYSQIGLQGGVYTFTLTDTAGTLSFTEKHQIGADGDTEVDFNFKQLAAQAAPSAEEQKKREESANKFKEMANHFNAGKAAMDDSDALRKQLATAPADQKSAIQEKMDADYKTAIDELQQAEQGVLPKDVKNHAVVWSTLGQAYDRAGRYDDAAAAYQKAIDANPQPSYYVDLSTALVNVAVAQTDPAALTSKLADAGAACDKATALDTTTTAATTARCWKNEGIVLSNKGHLAEALVPLQKTTQADPKDAQAWFLLGGALASQIVTKQEGNKLTYTFPPGLIDAYQQCIAADPNGPYAAQAKATLDGLNQLAGGTATVVNEKKPSTKKK
ncbi:MAG: carboxypeptidase regulatory-like domain-containing protein [Candidatus Acidiferrales bacterium]|jgi:tetratricopeptide (TPR) repeat protein